MLQGHNSQYSPAGKTSWTWAVNSDLGRQTMTDGKLWPKISVVTSSFNQGQYIEETIRSVLAQGYPNLEYIIIDGGSTDNSIEIIKKYEKDIDYWVSEPDSGPAEAIQKGFSRATGEWFCWLNSDDFFLPHALVSFAQICKASPSAEWITGCRLIVNSGGAPIQHSGKWYENGLNHLVRNAQGLAQEATFFKKEFYNQVGGINTNCKSIFDRELFLRMFEKTPPVFTPAVFGVIRLRPGQLSYDEFARRQDYKYLENIYNRRPLLLRFLARVSATRFNYSLGLFVNFLLRKKWFSQIFNYRVVLYDHSTYEWKECNYCDFNII